MTRQVLRHARTLSGSQFAQRSPVDAQHERTGVLKLRREEKRSRRVRALTLCTRFERLDRMLLRRIGTLRDLVGPMCEARRVGFAIEKVALMLRDEKRSFIDRVWFRFDLVNAAV